MKKLDSVAFTVNSGTASGSFVVSGSGIGNVSSSLKPSDTNDVSDVFGESPFGSKHGYVYSYFENVAASVDYSGGVSAVALPIASIWWRFSSIYTICKITIDFWCKK